MKILEGVISRLPRVLKQLLWFVAGMIPMRYELPFQFWCRKIRNQHEEEMSLLKDLVEENGTAIDVGANIGWYSIALSKICKNVEAFEPNPKCYEVLDAYNAKNINSHNVGLSSKNGELKFYIPVVNDEEITGLGSINSTEMECITKTINVRKLDDYGFKGVTFIKIDVEGHELEVIKGARNTLVRESPNLLVEIEQRHLSFPMSIVFKELRDLGYEGYFIFEKEIHPVTEFSYEKYQKYASEFSRNKKYINNFIFTKRNKLPNNWIVERP